MGNTRKVEKVCSLAKCCNLYSTSDVRKLYCSRECAVNASNARKPRAPTLGTRWCKNQDCGVAFIPKIHNQLYCSDICKTTWGNKEYTRLHPEWAREQSRLNYSTHKVERLASGKAYRQSKPREFFNEQHRRWRLNNPDWWRSQQSNIHKRLKRKTPIGRQLTWEFWLILCAAWGNRCAYCGLVAPLTQDHVVPLTRGGEHVPDNVVPACHSCNSSKNDSDVADFLISDFLKKRKAYVASL